MSRNLCRTTCYYCDSPVLPKEEPRLATKFDVGRYTEQYEGRLWCAAAVCPACRATYLAWYSDTPWPRESTVPECQEEIMDLSFRSSFDDEPDDADLPLYAVEKRWVRVGPWVKQ